MLAFFFFFSPWLCGSRAWLVAFVHCSQSFFHASLTNQPTHSPSPGGGVSFDTSWRGDLSWVYDGIVTSLVYDDDTRSLYVAGSFDRVNGEAPCKSIAVSYPSSPASTTLSISLSLPLSPPLSPSPSILLFRCMGASFR